MDGPTVDVYADAVWSYLPNNRSLVVELAAGNGQFSLELARRHPKTNYIAVDIKSDRLYSSARKAQELGVKNIAFVRIGVKDLALLLQKHSVDQLWITFPDPHPKKRSAKHRLTHPAYLAIYQDILKSGSKLHFKTDNLNLFQWSLEQFVTDDWRISELSFDLHETKLPDDYKIKTYYEERFSSEGIPTNYCTVSKT